MAQASESSASGPLVGELEGLFGSRKAPKPIYRDKLIRELERGLSSDINQARIGLRGDIDRYTNEVTANNPWLRRATQQSDRVAQEILNRRQNPLDRFKGLGDYLYAKTSAVPDSVINYFGNLGEVSNLARGINPGATSTYETLTRGGLAQRAALEANRAALAGLTSNYPALEAALHSQDMERLGILPLRTAGINALEGRALLPFEARTAGLGDLQKLGLGQNALNMGNLQGYKPHENWANRLAAAGRATTANINQIMDWAQQAASIYGSLMGGGGMSGLGSLFGGGGGSKPSPQNPNNPAPVAYPGGPTPGGGTYAPASGPWAPGYYPPYQYPSYPTPNVPDASYVPNWTGGYL